MMVPWSLEETLLGDLNSFQERYLALRQSMIDDGIGYGVPFHTKDLQLLSERIKAEGSSFFKVTLPKLGKALDQGLVSGRFISIPNFRLKRNTCLPVFCHQVFLAIFSPDGILRPDPNIQCLQFLRQFLLFDSKLYFEPSSEMKNLAVKGFSERMDELRKKRIPTEHPVIIRAVQLLRRVLAKCDLSDIKPGHGPGSVAEKTNRFERWDFTYWPLRAEKCYPFLLYGTHSIRAQLERGKGIKLHREMVTRCCLVPKDFKGPRLISAESAATQYLQQGQMKALMNYFQHNRLLSYSIKLQDQTYNQRAAEKSFEQDSATLDLSNASDTVSTTLVWHLLSGVPKLRRQLMSTRSDYLSYEGKKIRLVAFAPMGSAVCFPVETLVFWAISMASLMLVRSHDVTNSAGITRFVCSQRDSELAREIRVFGDDIIIPKEALPTLVSTLIEIGCTPNTSKTCSETPFRESCGSEWYNGTDVTIIRNKRYQYERNKFIDHPVLLDLQRKFFLQGWFKTASFLQCCAEEICPTCTIPISYLPDPGGILKEKFRLNIDSSRKIRLGSRCRDLEFLETRQQIVPNGDPRGSQEGLNVYERQAIPSDSYPYGFGHYFRVHPGSRVRYNKGYQRYECRVPKQFQRLMNWDRGDYPRLLARLLHDQVERIAIRDLRVGMAWSILPIPSGLSPRLS